MHVEYVVPLSLGSLYVAVLRLRIGGVEVDELVILVCLIALDQFTILLRRVELSRHILQEE